MAIRKNQNAEFIKQAARIIDEEVYAELSYLGQECVNDARSKSAAESYNDQTGNLRSSIGYAVRKKGGKTEVSKFDVVKEGSEGASKGKSYARKAVKALECKFNLSVVAGMEYAEPLQNRSKHSRNVLKATETWVRTQIEARMKSALETAAIRINRL